jgi:hypothetical protein
LTRWLLSLAALAALALAFVSWGNAEIAVRAWVCGFVLVSMVPIGSLALLLVYGISGGHWGDDLAPVLVPAARAMPFLLLAFLPVIVFRPLIYHWNELKLPHDVLAFYLNPLFFDLRTVFGLVVWSVLAWMEAWRKQLFAAIGLVAHFILMTFLPADWILTIQPGSTSAGFGFGFGIEQMFAALAFAAVVAQQQPGRPTRDLAGIMITTLLGTVYFLFMEFLITWYGNIPEKVHWFVSRTINGWPAIALAGFLIGAAIPFLAVLNPFVRREPAALRWVGAFALSGIALHAGWMIIPVLGNVTIAPAVIATLLMTLALWAAALQWRVHRGLHES